MGLNVKAVRWVALSLFAWASPDPLWAEPVLGRDLIQVAQGRVLNCPDARTVTLVDGSMVRLAGIDVPLPIPGGGQGPLAELARTRLCAEALGLDVTFYRDDQTEGVLRDRYGRLVAYAITADGVWLEGDLLQQGLARVLHTPGMSALADLAILHERAARAARLGIWDEPFYRVHSIDDLDHVTGQFLILEARLCAVTAEAEGWMLALGVGECRPEDRTNARAAALIMGPDKAFFTPGLSLLRRLVGRRLRLRGAMLWRGRPVLHLTHRTAVEPLEG